MFTEHQTKELSAPLSKEFVKTRSQAKQTLSYVEGWHVISEANRIFGYDSWMRETVYLKEVARYELKNKYGENQWKVGYEAKVRVTVGDTVREGTGYGQGTMKDLFDAMESAGKEAETDAMKRALMTFGNPFGLALYDKTQANVAEPRSAALDMAISAARSCQTKTELRALLAKNKAALDQNEARELTAECRAIAVNLPETQQQDAVE